MSSGPDMPLVADEHVLIPMRDGTELVASITRPAGDGPFPTILARTPYDRTGQRADAEQRARPGYASVGAACEATTCLSPSSGGSSRRIGARCSRTWLRHEPQRALRFWRVLRFGAATAPLPA